MYHVYILLSRKRSNWSYVGCTSDLAKRLIRHNQGKVQSTKAYRPLEVVYSEAFSCKKEAYARELFLKSGNGREEKQCILTKLL